MWGIVQQWYRGRGCAYCGKAIEKIHWHDHRPALLSHDKKTLQWSEIRTEKLPEVFETHLPVCGSYHIAETFGANIPNALWIGHGSAGRWASILQMNRNKRPSLNHCINQANTMVASVPRLVGRAFFNYVVTSVPMRPQGTRTRMLHIRESGS